MTKYNILNQPSNSIIDPNSSGEALREQIGNLEENDVLLETAISDSVKESIKLSEDNSNLSANNLLLQAEIQNIRKRNIAEIEKTKNFSVSGFSKDLLPIYDSLSKSLENIEEGTNAHEGISNTLNGLLMAFESNGVKIIEDNNSFNPEFHEAVSHIPVEGKSSGEIIEVLQVGFLIADRLLRPSMVIVAK